MPAFDIMGDVEMILGEPFSYIEDGKPHVWQELILDRVFITLADNLTKIIHWFQLLIIQQS